MKRSAIAAIGVSTLALVLSVVALVAAMHENSHDHGRDADHDNGPDPEREEAVARFAQRLASLEAELKELGSEQRALAARADKLDARGDRPALAAPGPDELRRIIDERAREIVVRATGKARLRPEDLPEAVTVSALGILGGRAEIARAEQRIRDGRTEFRLKARLGGEEYDLKVLPDGEVIEAEMPPDRAPQVVKDAAAKAAKGIKLSQVKLETGKGGVRKVYDVEGRAGGKKYDIIMTPDGQLIEVDGPGGKVRFDREPDGAGERPGARAEDAGTF